MTQTELDYTPHKGVKDCEKVKGAPTNSAELARRMIARLETYSGWMTRANFKDELGLSDRECRAGRRAAHGRIIAGQHGFRLTRHGTLDERRSWRNFLLKLRDATAQDIIDLDKAEREIEHGRRAI